jgi:hypothetical protein
MADVKISGLPASTTPLTGAEVLPLVQSGVTKKVAVSNLTGTTVSNAGEVGIGGDTSGVVAGVTVTSKFCVKNEGTAPVAGFVHAENITPTSGSTLFACRSRGTLTAPTIVQNNDRLATLYIAGNDGTDLALAAEIEFSVDGVPGSNDMPGRIIFKTTPDGSQTPVEALRLDSTQKATFAQAPLLTSLTASTALALDASKNITSVTNTGTGDNVLATSPTLVSPALGTPSSGVVTNLTGTASININGTVGATTRNTGEFTFLRALLNTGGSAGTNQIFNVTNDGVDEVCKINDGTNLAVANAAGSAMRIGRSSTTGRSINGAGTINASGADYAEYMYKNGDFVVAKGDVVGIDANGKLTNMFTDAVSFCVKSTNPSYVGNDIWGSIDALGKEPAKEATQQEKDAFYAKLESARQLVDRIAFSGQVPVNVTGAIAGQYIIPVDNDGYIKGQAISNPTFEQYQIAVGKVIAIESDGRAKIIVKVS